MKDMQKQSRSIFEMEKAFKGRKSFKAFHIGEKLWLNKERKHRFSTFHIK